MKSQKVKGVFDILKENWRRYRKNKAAVFALPLVLIFIVIAVIAPILSPYDPLKIGTGELLLEPCLEHPMGTDDLGRDVLSGFIYGARTSLLIGVVTTITSSLIGILVGVIAGYRGGWIDEILMRITEIFQVVPTFVLALVMVSVFGARIWNVIMVIALLSWPGTARLIRADVIALKEREFVEAARALGASDRDIIFNEILPNALTSVIVNTSLVVANAILTEAGLSFLGLGDPNVASWGRTLWMAQKFLPVGAWWLAFFPGMAILLTVLGYNLLGDGLNDLLNPKLKER